MKKQINIYLMRKQKKKKYCLKEQFNMICVLIKVRQEDRFPVHVCQTNIRKNPTLSHELSSLQFV